MCVCSPHPRPQHATELLGKDAAAMVKGKHFDLEVLFEAMKVRHTH